jgi:hypothetical protein
MPGGETAEDFEAVDPGQHPVEQDEVGRAVENAYRLLVVLHGIDAETVPLQVARDLAHIGSSSTRTKGSLTSP